MTIFYGIDWAERHHDVAVVDETGRVLITTRIGDDLAWAGCSPGCGEDLPAARIHHLVAVFAAEQPHQPPQGEQAMGIAVQALVRTVTATRVPIVELADPLAARFAHHPDAGILRSLPGLGPILGARVLGRVR
jgi:hypothetical protein